MNKAWGIAFVSIAAAGLGAAWLAVTRRTDDALVVYCAHDMVFAEQLLDDFYRETGIRTEVVADTEAAKSLGLVQRLEREAEHPRCDVFWNNEPLGTFALADKDVLESYASPESSRRSAAFQDPAQLWTGFGVRFRVWIVNSDLMPPTEVGIEDRLDGTDLSRMAVAVPLYGTTLTHYSLMWNVWGPDKLKAWHASLKERGCNFVKGNGAVKDLVASGACDFGLTDTDDFFVAKDQGAPVEMLPVRLDGRSIAIPNTVSVIRGTQHRDKAHQFVDFLLSARSDERLANSGSRQSPVHNDADPKQLPPDSIEMLAWTKDAASLRDLRKSREECLDWLQREFAP
jgi:iron(III) transport system substrate-binding protein